MREKFVGYEGQPAHQDVPPTHEFRHQDIVPKFHVLAFRLYRGDLCITRV